MKQLPLTLNTKRKFIKIAVVLGSHKDYSEVAMDVLTVRVCLVLYAQFGLSLSLMKKAVSIIGRINNKRSIQ